MEANFQMDKKTMLVRKETCAYGMSDLTMPTYLLTHSLPPHTHTHTTDPARLSVKTVSGGEGKNRKRSHETAAVA